MIAHLAIILMCAAHGLLNVRMLAVGDSLALVYEIARQAGLGIPRDFFVARRNQEAMAGVVASLPPSATVHALMEGAAYPMTYLSGRTVKSFKPQLKESGEHYLLVQPSDHSIWLPPWNLISWLQGNTTLVERRGEYALYRVHEGAQPPDW